VSETTGLTDRRTQRKRMLLLWYALVGGVAWWGVHLVAGIAMVPAACEFGTGWSWGINGLTAVTAVGAVSAIWASIVLWRDPTPVSMVTDRSRFLGTVAILFNVISLALIILEGIPNLVLSPCLR
jgi:hypothetical protein